jgi:type I thyroxine 5'-deiodinase
MREAMMSQMESEAMEGLSIERLRDAMYRPNALEVMSEMFASGPGAANEGMDAPDFELPYLPGQGGQEGENEEEGVLLRQHQSMEERVEVGQACMLKLAFEMPALVDEMDDEVAKAYAAMPERLYLIGRDGKVAHQGGMGPMYFRPSEWHDAIASYLGS